MTLRISLRCLVPVIAVLCLAAPPALALHFRNHHPRVERTHVRQGDWRLDTARDAFSGDMACVLRGRQGHAIYAAGAVGFRFDPHQDVTRAVYRLDTGPLRTARDDLPRLIVLRTPIDRGPMDHAANGLVWVPFDLLDHVGSITIEPAPGQRMQGFSLRGLAALHDLAITRGCTPEGRFVEQ